MTAADYPDWQTPQAHANALNATGVPLLRNITVLNTTAVTNAGTSGGPFVQVYDVFYEGYLIEVIPQNPGTRIFAVDLAIAHLDASGNQIAVEQVTLSNWQNLGNNTSIVRGRLLGTSLNVVAQVAASAWLNTITGGAVTADNVKIRFCGLQTYVPGTSKRVPVITSSVGLLLNSQATVALTGVNGNNQFVGVLPDYTGPVVVSSSTPTGGGFTYTPRITGFSVANGPTALTVQDFPSVLNGTPLITTVSLPSTFNTANIIQRSTVAASAGFAVTVAAADQ